MTSSTNQNFEINWKWRRLSCTVVTRDVYVLIRVRLSVQANVLSQLSSLLNVWTRVCGNPSHPASEATGASAENKFHQRKTKNLMQNAEISVKHWFTDHSVNNVVCAARRTFPDIFSCQEETLTPSKNHCHQMAVKAFQTWDILKNNDEVQSRPKQKRVLCLE